MAPYRLQQRNRCSFYESETDVLKHMTNDWLSILFKAGPVSVVKPDSVKKEEQIKELTASKNIYKLNFKYQ